MTLNGRAALLLAPTRARLLLAAGVLAAAAIGFAAFGPGNAASRAATQVEAAAATVRSEQPGLRRRLRALATPPAAPADGDPTRFMRAVHEAAARSSVQVVRLAPRQGRDEAAMDLQLAATYAGFLRFAAELELLGATLRLPQVQAAEGRGAGDAAALPLRISLVADLPRRGPSAGAHADAALRAASAEGLRDPFQPVGQAGVPRDLSAEYRLSGITAGRGGATATINGLDYEENEELDGMRVVSIADDAVHLLRGAERFVIGLPALPSNPVPAAQPAPRTVRRR